jgi:putative tryptophan/tyrosine transport system substrate-binding protein
MRRREFITVLGGAAAAWPLAARAQQSALPVVGVLSASSAELSAHSVRAFRQGLSETGHIEGRNIAVEYRWAHGQNDQLPALAADLVRSHVTVIVTLGSTPAAVAAKAATTTIPIVFQVGSDPVAAGLVTSIVRPGGNATGVTNLNTELEPKRLDLLRQVVPTANVIALLVNPSSPFITETVSRDLETAARILGLQLHILQASSEREFEGVFEHLGQARAAALVIAPDALFISRSDQLADLTVRHGMPAISQFREFPLAGGLMSYGGSFTDTARLVGIYTGRVVRGEKPADLPVQQTTKVELVINLKTATALGVTVPPTLLTRADEVIE